MSDHSLGDGSADASTNLAQGRARSGHHSGKSNEGSPAGIGLDGTAEPIKPVVPKLKFELEGIAPRARFDAWVEALSAVYDSKPVGSPQSFSGRMAVSRPGDLVLFDGGYTPQTCTRTRRHTQDSDHFQVVFYGRGGLTGARADQPFEVNPAQIALCDFGRPHHAVVSEPSELLAVAIPRTQIDPKGVGNRPTIGWSTSSAAGRLLLGALQTLKGGVELWSPEEAAVAADGLVGLVNGLLGSRRQVFDPTPIARISLPTIKHYIEEHLSNKELNASALCRWFGCSRSVLYHLFKGDGGVENYLHQRKLSRCFTELAAADPSRGRVKEIAERWGYNNPSHFHRIFKQHFGVKPAEVLANTPTRHLFQSSNHLDLPAGGTIETWLGELLKPHV